jgi:Fe-S cluster assembly scaffold protein SufB
LVNEKGYFILNKGNKKTVPARYNPYFHTSPTPLNDQFAEAQDRPELVTVEVEVPKSELTSGYKAEKAKDAVGEIEWKAGVVQGKLSGKRKVILSRYDKPIRIVPNAEVAERIVEMIDGKDVVFPSNVVTPQLREELEKKGVQFKETDNQGKPRFSISNIAEDAWNKYQYDGELESIRDVANYIEENMPKNEQTQALFDAIDAYNEEEFED